jgi:hypothetical protein
MVGQFGTPEEIRCCLDEAGSQSAPPDPGFVNGLLGGLGKRKDVVPDLTAFCRKQSAQRDCALMELAWLLPEKDLPRVWAEWLADSDSVRRWEAMKALFCSPHVSARFTVLASFLESPNPIVEDAEPRFFRTVCGIQRFRPGRRGPPKAADSGSYASPRQR